MMRVHHLKTQQPWYDQLVRGEKIFELRRDDRNYAVGDLLFLHEWSEEKGWGTAAFLCAVCGILRGPIFGLAEGWVILSYRILTDEERVAPELNEAFRAAALLARESYDKRKTTCA